MRTLVPGAISYVYFFEFVVVFQKGNFGPGAPLIVLITYLAAGEVDSSHHGT